MILIVAAASLVCFQLYTAATITLTAMLQRSIHLGLGLGIVFIVYSFDGKKDQEKSLAWEIIDFLLMIMAFIGSFYISLNWEILSAPSRLSNPTPIDIILGICTIMLVLEATRRVVGWALPIISLISLSYLFLGPWFPVLFRHPGTSLRSLIAMGYMYTEGIFASPLGASTNVVFIFIFFGYLLQSLGGGEFMLDIANTFVGKLRGGPAKVAIIASGFFGSMSGSAVANVVGTGAVTIPIMQKVGYKKDFAGAVEAVASTGGLIMPPIMGASAFIMSEIIRVPYITIASAAAIPAILYYVGLYIAIDLRARRLGLKGLNSEDIIPLRKTLKSQGLIFLPPIVLLVFFMMYFQYSVDRAAFWAVILLSVLALTNNKTRILLKKVTPIILGATKSALTVIVATSCAGLVLVTLQVTGLGLRFSSIMVQLSGGNLIFLLLLTAVASLILGMGLPASACYIILAIFAAPAIVQLGSNILAAHLFVLYFGALSAITPPVCLAAYAACGISEGSPMKTGFESFRIALPIFLIAFFFVFQPEVILVGSLWGIVTTSLLCLVGLAFLTIGLEGYFTQEISTIKRIFWSVGGILLIWPGLYITGLGLIIGAACLISDPAIRCKLSLYRNRVAKIT